MCIALQLRGAARTASPGAAGAVNKMVDQLSSFTGELTRVRREAGTAGRLGGRAKVHDIALVTT